MATIGLDLAKTSVFFVGLDASGYVRTLRQYSKAKLLAVTSAMSPRRIGMEACCGAHHLGRALEAQGHDVRLMPPKYVKPFVKRDKNDSRTPRPARRPACARPCASWPSRASSSCRCSRCTGTVRGWWPTPRSWSTRRAFLLERGIAVPQGKGKFAERLPEILEDADNGLPDAMRELVGEMATEWGELEGRIAGINAACRRRRRRTRPAGGCWRCRASGRRRPRGWWRPSTAAAPSCRVSTSRPGWG